MIVKITTFKKSGKWYDEFLIKIPDSIPCHNAMKLQNYIESTCPTTKRFNYTYKIDDDRLGFWQWRLVINI